MRALQGDAAAEGGGLLRVLLVRLGEMPAGAGRGRVLRAGPLRLLAAEDVEGRGLIAEGPDRVAHLRGRRVDTHAPGKSAEARAALAERPMYWMAAMRTFSNFTVDSPLIAAFGDSIGLQAALQTAMSHLEAPPPAPGKCLKVAVVLKRTAGRMRG